jgi:hypothetical protein
MALQSRNRLCINWLFVVKMRGLPELSVDWGVWAAHFYGTGVSRQVDFGTRKLRIDENRDRGRVLEMVNPKK